MKAAALWIVEPGRVELRPEDLPQLAEDQVLVLSMCSAISPGTERLFYLGRLPVGTEVDSQITSLNGGLRYPLKYGYATVGRVSELGGAIDPSWQDRNVFAFHPHQSAFVTSPDALIPLPADLPAEQAAFLANTETALSLIHDGAPLAGERARIHGLGVVGLLTLSLLSRFPLAQIVAVDPIKDRQKRALNRGATLAIHPSQQEALTLGSDGCDSDLTFELSGSDASLDQAIQCTGYGGRIVIGSWYGDQPAKLHLGSRFHRSRLQLISSQVSTIAPSLSARWTKQRRIEQALQLLPAMAPANLITHRIPFSQADEAYRLLTDPNDALGIVLTYQD
jgi:2-desacetyl-2-hydroxyethyl bacteriochlorophyllide A dehydrogenase